MTSAEIEAYLKELSDGGSDSDLNEVPDSEDEEWVPQSLSKMPASDNEEYENSDYEDEIPQQDADFDSSDSEDNSEIENAEPEVTGSYISKDNTIWKEKPPNEHQVAAHNILRQRSGPHRSTETLSISETFKIIFNENMVDIIVRHTNKKALSVYAAYNVDHPNSQRQCDGNLLVFWYLDLCWC